MEANWFEARGTVSECIYGWHMWR